MGLRVNINLTVSYCGLLPFDRARWLKVKLGYR